MMKNTPDKTDIIQATEFIRNAIGDECGSIFVDKTVYANKDKAPKITYTVTVFHGEWIAANVHQSSRLDQACIKAVRKFAEYMEVGQ